MLEVGLIMMYTGVDLNVALIMMSGKNNRHPSFAYDGHVYSIIIRADDFITGKR